MMDKTFKWGIIGPGKIAKKFAAALALVDNAKLQAVASRSEEKARMFAAAYSAPVFYSSYEALADDNNIDAVYIATPHTFHHAHALLCLKKGKAVLCEKPMSVNYSSTLEMVQTARQYKVFLMEAMWTRFLPIINKTAALIQEGAIGTLKYLRADFGFVSPYDAGNRLYDLTLGGGSLLDVGIYPLFLALFIMGKPDQIKTFAHVAASGADETTSALLFYNNGSMATIVSSIVAQTPLTAEITGTTGTIILDRPWYKGSSLRVRKDDTITGTFSLPYGDNGFEFQIREVQDCLLHGLTESSKMPLDLSLLVSTTIDEINSQHDIFYKVR